MPLTRILALAVMLCAASLPARAETAREVQSSCKDIAHAKSGPNQQITITSNYRSGFCWGTFASVQGLISYVSRDGARILRFCPPEGTTRLDLIRVFSKFVDDKPSAGHQDFMRVALRALSAAYPCPGVPAWE